ncbi:MAG TPA: C25 family cysteine peptidase, partial [Chitinispirillaceae bacterium]|nr:C25 family cysteine peptidase [Chitinispirillaceae bacterium]
NTYVDSDDYFLAFVTGASDWFFIHNREYSFNLDRYDDYRKYWLTVSNGGGMSVNSFPACSVGGDTISSVENGIIFGKNSLQTLGNEGGLEWCWFKLSDASSFDFPLQLPGLDTSFGGSVTVKCPGGTSISMDVSLDEPLVSLNGVYTINRWGNRSLKILSKANDLEIQNINVKYKRKLVVGDAGKLEIFSPVDTILYTYKLKVSTNDLYYLFRISNDEKNVSIIDTVRNAANSFISWTDTGGKGIRYMVCSEKALTPLPEKSVNVKINADFLVDNPRITSDSTDYLIISAPEFLTEASKLAVHKKKIGFNAPRVVNVKDVFDAFSGGNVDPAAIRNFIAYVQNYWKGSQHLSYVLLFGSGHYDYKGVLTKTPVYIPVFYSGHTLLEDFYTIRYGVDQTALGRITCDSTIEATDVVEKIIAMEDPQKADYSDWRNRALLVADDDRQGTTVDGINHHGSSDNTADVIESKNPSINLRKVYLFDYKWNSAGQKPEASKVLFNEIDNGVGYVNYFGHGSEAQWAQEKILLADNVKALKNENHYPLISSFSCSVGRFDIPNYECLSSALLTKGECGAIASISSTRTAYASSNENLAINFYSALLNPSLTHENCCSRHFIVDRNVLSPIFSS